jgi:hypothetical protein
MIGTVCMLMIQRYSFTDIENGHDSAPIQLFVYSLMSQPHHLIIWVILNRARKSLSIKSTGVNKTKQTNKDFI